MNIVVYTANIGKRDAPRTAAELKGIRQISHKRFPRCPVVTARCIKTLSHLFVPDADVSIWIDFNVFLNKPPEAFVEMLGACDIGAFARYPADETKTAYDEGWAVRHRDGEQRMTEQLAAYQASGFEGGTVISSSVLVRRHTPEVVRFNEAWWAQLSRHTMRDQVSFPYVVDRTGVTVAYWPNVNLGGKGEYYDRRYHGPDEHGNRRWRDKRRKKHG